MEIAQPPLVIKDKLASRIKVISKLDISEKRVPQDGRMKIVLSKSKAIDFRVSTLPTLFGEKIVMRILVSSGSSSASRRWLRARPAESADGRDQSPLRLDTRHGPFRQRETVSLYTCLNLLNQPGVNISTAEDPAEIQLAGGEPGHMNEKAGLTFPVALRAFLRQDPDDIMVGEIRDLETAEISVKRRRRVHLVLSTLTRTTRPRRCCGSQHGGRSDSTWPRRSSDHRPAPRPQALRHCKKPRTFPRKR
jgi:type IV pilus assembly protein PilB